MHNLQLLSNYKVVFILLILIISKYSVFFAFKLLLLENGVLADSWFTRVLNSLFI